MSLEYALKVNEELKKGLVSDNEAHILLRWYRSMPFLDGMKVQRYVERCTNIVEAELFLERLCIMHECDPFFRAAHIPFELQLQGEQ
jgi:hypothetical protein